MFVHYDIADGSIIAGSSSRNSLLPSRRLNSTIHSWVYGTVLVVLSGSPCREEDKHSCDKQTGEDASSEPPEMFRSSNLNKPLRVQKKMDSCKKDCHIRKPGMHVTPLMSVTTQENYTAGVTPSVWQASDCKAHHGKKAAPRRLEGF
jgi:hypothetical protein